MRHASVVFVLTLASAAIVSAADAPYFGKWKPDSAKSQLTSTATIEKLPSGEFRFNQDGFIYNFRLDGKEYPMPDGGTTSWKAIDDNHWEVKNRANGSKVAATFKLTVNGDALSAVVTVPQADGHETTQSASFQRVSGGPGFLGKFKETQADLAETWLEVTPDGADGLKIAQPNSLCVAKFDGKPYPMSGPGDPPKQTMAFRKKGPAAFEALTYVDGKLFTTDVYSVSADGKVLTDIGTPAATKKPAKVIFDRQ
jgi:hypothetical protein